MNNESTNKKDFDLYETVTNRIIALLEAGTVPWKHFANRTLTQPRNAVTKREYNGINYFFLNITAFTKGYSSNEWLTYKQAANLGGNVKKGEKSEIVVFWKFLEKIDKETGEQKRIPMLRYFRVFNVDQCEGLKVRNMHEARDSQAIDAAEAIIAGMPNPPKIVIDNSPSAYFDPQTDAVHMLARERCKTDEQYYSSIFHELAHATGHVSRLDRVLSTDKNSTSYWFEELIAEMGAAMLSAHAGIFQEIEENAAAYCAAWIERLKTDKHMLVKAGGRSRKAVEYILDIKAAEAAEGETAKAA